MSNIRKKWTKSEEDDLIDSYINEELDLPDIAEIHGRTPLGIASRLVKLNAAKDIAGVKGYNGKIPEKLLSLKSTGPILRKKNLLQCGTIISRCSPVENELKPIKTPLNPGKIINVYDMKCISSHAHTYDDALNLLHCSELKCEELIKENEYLRIQLLEAMKTIDELSSLL
jgi:hypothetical protein